MVLLQKVLLVITFVKAMRHILQCIYFRLIAKTNIFPVLILTKYSQSFFELLLQVGVNYEIAFVQK